MRQTFNSIDEALGFYYYLLAKENISHPNSVAFNIGTSAEHLLKEIHFRITNTKYTTELINLIKWFQSETKNRAFVNEVSEKFTSFLHRLRADRNLFHKEVFIFDTRYIIDIIEEYKVFMKWYSDEYDIINWENIWESEKHKYLPSVPKNSIAPKTLEIITNNYFDKEVVSEEQKKQITIDYYLKFNNSWSYIKRVIANDIHIIPINSFKIKIQGEEEEKKNIKIEEILQIATKGQPVLIKIAAVGGVGKSTLLWHFIKIFSKSSNCFYIERADPNAIDYLFENIIVAKTDSPVLLFLDDVVSSEENKKNLISFGEAIAEKSPNAPIVLFAAERFYRYERFKEKKDFERNFSSVISLPYSNDSIRNKVFEKIYDSLNIAEENPSSKFKEDCQNIFNQYDFDSLIDSTYHLIKYLQKSTSSININYKFDWEDWTEACNNNIQKYGILEDLFKLVAFFYQYGIPVPFDYLKEHYKNSPRINDLTREIIGNFGEEYSPIVLENDEDSEKRILRLRHEKMGEWFFQNTTDSKQVEKELFLEFIDNIKSRPACYLFRNIHRSAEFLISHLHQYLSNKKRIKVIDGYLSTVEKSDYTEEEFKTLMEKHFTLINMGQSEDSLTPLEEILKHNEDNIFAATRLATCIENEYPERAEKLYKQAQESSKKNKIITLSLYRLYYANPALKQFEDYQNSIFEIASANTSFAFYLIGFIENNIGKLFQSTLVHILNLHPSHILLRLNIAELLINKRKI